MEGKHSENTGETMGETPGKTPVKTTTPWSHDMPSISKFHTGKTTKPLRSVKPSTSEYVDRPTYPWSDEGDEEFSSSKIHTGKTTKPLRSVKPSTRKYVDRSTYPWSDEGDEEFSSSKFYAVKTTERQRSVKSSTSLQDRAFDYLIKNLADAISSESSLKRLGLELGLKTPDIELALETNRGRGIEPSEGRRRMLQNWIESVEPSERISTLRAALKKADLGELEEKYLLREFHTEALVSLGNELMRKRHLNLFDDDIAKYFFALEIMGKAVTHKTSRVNELSLDSEDVTSLWKLGLHTSCPQLQKLNLHFGFGENVSSGIVTKACSPFHHLTHLCIKGCKGTVDPESFPSAVITSCPQLSKLSIHHLDLHNEKVAEIIGSMKTHPHLTNLELLYCGSDWQLDQFIAKVNSEGKLTVTATHGRVIRSTFTGTKATKEEIREIMREYRQRLERKEMPSITKKSSTSLQESSSMSSEWNITPMEMECRKSVGVEGSKLQLKSFGIELEIPSGAIDSETPRDISLRVLTDTANLGNSKDEMSVCFGVQCVAPDDLDLKLPVTYTIPHCAEITRFSSVEAVLYTGEGKYTPDAVIKERILLSSSGMPSCIIMKDELKLKMNHFSWAEIRLRIKNFFSQKKRMCCRPFRDRNLPVKTEPVILRAYLYRDIQGNRELIKSQEAEQDFIPAHPEMEVSVIMAEVDLTMTCSIKETVIERPAVVSFERLKSGQRICQSFSLDFTKQPDSVVVSMRVGQNPRLEVNLMFALKFTGPQGSPPNQEQLKVSSSSRTPLTSHRTEEDTLNSVKETEEGKVNDFDEMLKTVAKRVVKRMEIDDLGKALGFMPEDISRYIETNNKSGQEVTCDGTLLMLRDWRKKQTKDTESVALKTALEESGQIHLANELFGTK